MADITFPYYDGLMRSWTVGGPWEGFLGIEWMKPGHEPWKARRTLKKLEQAAKLQKFKGWLMYSELDHHNMHRHIQKWGGKAYAADKHNVYFVKEWN